MDSPMTLSFSEQIKYFTQKLLVLAASFLADPKSSHDKAFTIAGVTSKALLKDLHSAVQELIDEGMTLKEFNDQFEDIVAKHGWTGWTGEGTARGRAWRSRIIADTNLRTSYAAGRWQQQQATKDVRSYLLYKHRDDEMYPRPVHVAWHGVVLPIDHDWWKTHYPPCGYGCKCQVFSLSAADLESYRLTVTPDDRIPPGDADKSFGKPPVTFSTTQSDNTNDTNDSGDSL